VVPEVDGLVMGDFAVNGARFPWYAISAVVKNIEDMMSRPA